MLASTMTTTAEAAFRNYNVPLPKYYTAAVIHVILAPPEPNPNVLLYRIQP
jgi:hypothetical protein